MTHIRYNNASLTDKSLKSFRESFKTEEITLKKKKTYRIFEGVFRGDVIKLLDCEGRQVEAAAMAFLHTPLVVVLLVGWKQ